MLLSIKIAQRAKSIKQVLCPCVPSVCLSEEAQEEEEEEEDEFTWRFKKRARQTQKVEGGAGSFGTSEFLRELVRR